MPARSALTVTPRTAATVPITFNVDGHCSCAATMVVTASGGGWNAAPWAMVVWICLNFTKPSAPTNSSVKVSIRTIRLAMNVTSSTSLDVQQHAAVEAMAVAGLLSEERRPVILRLHRDVAIVTTHPPSMRVPAHAAADVAGEER